LPLRESTAPTYSSIVFGGEPAALMVFGWVMIFMPSSSGFRES
jgi:hypothetical protein